MTNETSTSKTTDEGLKALQASLNAAKQLKTAEAEMRAEHAGLIGQRAKMLFGNAGNASETEIIENIERLVNEKAAEYAERQVGPFVRSLGGRNEPTTGPKEFREVSPRLPGFGSALTFEDLCGLAPSLVKAGLVEIVRRPTAQFGLPKVAREAKVKELDAAIAKVEATHTKLVEDAAGFGMTLPLLDAVVTRRTVEARAAQTAADRAAGRFYAGA